MEQRMKSWFEALGTAAAITALIAVAMACLFVIEHARVLLLAAAMACAVVVAAGCIVGPPIPVPTDVAGTADDCKPACDNLARLGCPGHEGSPGMDGMFDTVDDVSCEQACRDIVGADSHSSLYQRCVAQVSSCNDADRCLAEGP